MNIINKVTLKNMIKNKVRTIVTILGIILSAAMICAVTVMASSLQQFMRDRAIDNNGDWFGNYASLSAEDLKKVESDKKITTKIEAQAIGYAYLENNRWEQAPYIYITGADKQFFDSMSVKIENGRLPENDHEIIIPLHLLYYEDMNDKFKIGDKMTLDVGHRYCDGKILGQLDSYMEDEKLKDTKSTEYTIVGFYKKPGFEYYDAAGYTAITMAQSKETYEGLYDLYFKTNNPKNFFIEYNTKNSEFKINTNSELLIYYWSFLLGSISSFVFSIAVIIIIIIMVGSISLIYNSFAMSVSERTKEFGILSSIGATKKQLKKSIVFEACALSIVGIPIGVLSGIGGIWVTLLLIGDKFKLFFETDLPVRISVSLASVIAAFIVSFITVLISAWIPSKRAVKISAIEAIRLNNDIKETYKKIKSNKMLYKIFGFEGMIADKYFRRSRKKYRATVISLFISIVLFVVTGYFCDTLKTSVEMADNSDLFDIEATVYTRDSDEEIEKINTSSNGISDNYIQVANNDLNNARNIFEKIKKADEVNKACMTFTTYCQSELSEKYINKKIIDENYGLLDKNGMMSIHTFINFVDDDSYKLYLDENNLDKSVFYNIDQPVALCYINNKHYNSEKERYENFNMLNCNEFEIESFYYKKMDGYRYEFTGVNSDDSVNYAHYSKIDDPGITKKFKADEVRELLYKHTIGFTTDKKPIFISSSEPTMIIIYPQSFMNTIIKQQNTYDVTRLRIVDMYFTSNNHRASYKSMEEIRRGIELENNSWINIIDRAEESDMSKNAVLAVNVFSYGFITLITLIAIANVFNTISSNILLRRRDFAMLKSVGMTNRGLNKMLGFECIMYGAKSLVCGLPAAVFATFIIYKVLDLTFGIAYILPLRGMIISMATVFIVVFVTMMYAIRRMKKDDPINGLRNENI